MDITVKAMPWGSSYGLRIRKKDFEKLGIQPGTEFQIHIADFGRPKDLSDLPTFKLGGDVSTNHDVGFPEL